MESNNALTSGIKGQAEVTSKPHEYTVLPYTPESSSQRYKSTWTSTTSIIMGDYPPVSNRKIMLLNRSTSLQLFISGVKTDVKQCPPYAWMCFPCFVICEQPRSKHIKRRVLKISQTVCRCAYCDESLHCLTVIPDVATCPARFLPFMC